MNAHPFPPVKAAKPSPRASAEGRYFSHRLFGLCGKGGACPPAPAAAAAAAEPSTPRWRGEAPAPKKAA